MFVRCEAGVAVQRAEKDRDILSPWPVPAKETGAADTTERFRVSRWRPVVHNEICPLKQAEPVPAYSRSGNRGASGLLLTMRAVAEVAGVQRSGDLVANAAAQARALQRGVGARRLRS